MGPTGTTASFQTRHTHYEIANVEWANFKRCCTNLDHTYLNFGANGCGSENVSTVDTKREKENSKINGIFDKSDGWKLHIGGMTHQRRSASPMLGNSIPFSTSEILNSFSTNRSHSGTPCSFTSDPCAYPSHHDPPAPPPRSSSRTTLASRLGNSELDELTKQLSLGTCSSGVGEESRLLNSTDTGDWKDGVCDQQDFENELKPVTPPVTLASDIRSVMNYVVAE